MSENSKLYTKKAGSPPGTLIHVGNKKTDKIKVSIFDYNESHFNEINNSTIEDCKNFIKSDTTTWINIDGLHQPEIIEKAGNIFGIHPLIQEDILNTNHRPKAEVFENHVFITLKMVGLNKKGTNIKIEQISIVLGENWILSFQEQEGDLLDILRDRIRNKIGTVRSKKADYLLYRFLDIIVDNYFFVIEHYNDEIEKLESEITTKFDDVTILQIQDLKKQIVQFRRIILPLREAISFIEKYSNELIQAETNRYLRDVYEHIVQLNDSIEIQKESIKDLIDLHQNRVGNRTNKIMQILTVISTIFIPLTFIAGVYGMNFEFMPELKWRYGYLIIWVLFVIIIFWMLNYFRKKKWL